MIHGGSMSLKKFQLSFIFLALYLFSFAAQANQSNEQFYAFQQIDLYEVFEEEGVEIFNLITSAKYDNVFAALSKAQGVTKVNIDGAIMMTKKLIVLGKEIYQIVEAGKPVVTTQSQPVEVLPMDKNAKAIQAIELAGWDRPKAKKYRIETKNYLGMSPVVFDFLVIFTYGGNYEGKGKYITGAQIKPNFVSVKWGYKFDASFKVQTVINEGTYENPIAGAVLMLDSKISTIMQEQQTNKTFYINGLGQINSY
jgi:hypothetical protein